MSEELEIVIRVVLIGIGATAVMDLWGAFLKQAFGVPRLDYAFLGRWIGHFPGGRFMHDNIVTASPVRGERIIGWAAHYAIGITFAALLLAIWGLEWAQRPTLLPALIIGIVTVIAPFFLMQPGLGLGVAASKTPRPNVARLRSIITHSVYGVGLFLSALLCAWLIPT